MRKPIISIIVPAYNSAETLRRCFKSILIQSFSDWECIVINDGSTDSTPTICDEYAALDRRFRVFHKENGGVSSARNLGLKNSCGDWIVFLDADDQLTKDAFDKNALESHSDIVLNSYYYIRSNNKTTNSEPLPIQQLDFRAYLEKNIGNTLFCVIWGKMFSARVIEGITFDTSLKIGEDTLFTMNCLNKCTTYSITERPSYIYYVPDCLTKKYSQDVKESIHCLKEIFASYRRLNIINLRFETKLFSSYKALCQDNIYNDVKTWYDDRFIKETYNKIKKGFPHQYRLGYAIMSKQLVSNILCKLIHRR